MCWQCDQATPPGHFWLACEHLLTHNCLNSKATPPVKAGVACEVASRSLSFRFQILRDNETRTRVSATARHPQQPGHGHTCARGIIGVGSRARGRCRRALALGPARHATQGKVSEHRRWRSGYHLARGGGGGHPRHLARGGGEGTADTL